MKVLILSITAGQGHHATAEAICKEFSQRGIECQVTDAYEYIAPLLKEAVANGYLLSTAYTPKTAGKLYRMAETKGNGQKRTALSRLANTILAHGFDKYISEYDPDIIICTHVFAAGLVSVLKSKMHIRGVSAGVITDFTIHPFWEDMDYIDYFIVANDALIYPGMMRGMDEKKMLPFGIPIDPKFSRKISKRDARLQLGLDPDKKTLLLMSGSMGYGRLDQAIEKLDSLPMDFQALVVCGNNKAVKRRAEKIVTRKKFVIHGFVNNVDVMMDAADCIVTKPGGLTSSEALAKELPMIMMNPIPGQEERNVEFLLNGGLALSATKTYPLDEAVSRLFSNPQRMDSIVANIRREGKKNSTERLCDFMIKKAEEIEL